MAKHKKKEKSKKKRKHKDKDKLKKEKILPSIDDLIAQKVKEKKSTNSQNSEAESTKSLAPMTKAQYDEKQSVVRRIFDEDTGRTRLVKGDGEIIEEIVSASRQKEINKMATQGDGNSFQSSLSAKLKDS